MISLSDKRREYAKLPYWKIRAAIMSTSTAETAVIMMLASDTQIGSVSEAERMSTTIGDVNGK
jgi:hypothetical protein